jgi:hypothetical protein
VLGLESGADSVPVLVDRVSVEDGSSLGLSWFMVDRRLPIAETTDETAEVSVIASAELVTGRVLGAAGHPGYFSGIRFAMGAEVATGVGVSEPSEHFALLPVAAFHTEADAVDFHESMVEASQGGGSDELELSCINPNWRGFNGVECCMFESAYQNGLEPCMAGPAFCAPCTKACFLLGGLAGLGSVIACELQNQQWYQACILEKLAAYQTSLGDNGCPPKPGAQGAVRPTTAAESGILDKADSLATEVD